MSNNFSSTQVNIRSAIQKAIGKTKSVLAGMTKEQAQEHLEVSRKNLIINGGFDVWQRGTSNTASSGARFLADRWCLVSGTGTASSSRQEFTQGQTAVPNNPKYYHRINVATSGNYTHFDNRIEGVEYSNGKQMTLSFWAKASSNMLLGLELVQRFGGTPEINGGERNVFTTGEGFSLTTSWQKFTLTHTFSSFSGETITNANYFTVRFAIDSESSYQTRWGGQVFTGDVDISQVQLELGDTATDFEHRSYGEELALCQRYYQTFANLYINGTNYPANEVLSPMMLPVEMRAAPTVLNFTTTSGTPEATGANSYSIRYLTATGHTTGGFSVGVDLDAEL